MDNKYGYYKLFAVSPRVHLANCSKNLEEHISALDKIKKSNNNGSCVVLFPELSLTGYSCEDLFFTKALISNAESSLLKLADATKNSNQFIVVGLPYSHKNKVYNCAATIFKGKIVSVHSKIFLPNYKEFFEKRHFSSGKDIGREIVKIGKNEVLFSNEQIIALGDLKIGIEICEDLWAPENPGTKLALNGANLLLNLSASNELIGKNSYRRDLVKMTSARLNCGYLYVSCNSSESTKETVFSGSSFYAEDGSILAEGKKLQFSTEILETEIDTQRIQSERVKNTTFEIQNNYKITSLSNKFEETVDIKRDISATPFVPENSFDLENRVKEVLEIQSTGLARRLMSISNNCGIVLGLSGGLDSTLSLLVAVEALKKLKYSDNSRIHCVSMPGFGTSERTKNQARALAKSFNVSFEEIDITEECSLHLKKINHEKIDFVYENVQARIRTAILFNLANKLGSIVQGTSSGSELYQGYATFSGDHTSSYAPSNSLGKTLVRFMIKHYPTEDSSIKEVLEKVYNTPISPELLPLDKQGEIAQKTESIIGPYELVDFHMYYFLKFGFSNEKIVFLAKKAFKGKYSEEHLKESFNTIYSRFRKNAFKRTVSMSGLKVASISLSSRTDLRIPDEYEGDKNESEE